tara:strand:- start:203 stop:484 length:282 start_codon:yes stop_codon:yes gene_type:complete
MKGVKMKNYDKYEIYTVPSYEGNAYIEEPSGNGGCEFLWTAPLFKHNVISTIDDSQWGIVEDDDIINSVLDSAEKIVLGEISVDDFNKLLGAS